MKKIMIATVVAFLGMATIIVSCKKDDLASTTGANIKREAVKATTMTSSFSVSVDPLGFLSFPSITDASAYVKHISQLSLTELYAYHSNLGFSNLAGGKYDHLDEGNRVTPEQIKDFVLDANGLVKIGGTVFKPEGENQYLITMHESALTSGGFGKIVSGVFDANIMNRFASSTVRDDNFDLITTVDNIHAGIFENYVNGPVYIDAVFWGWGPWTCGECGPGPGGRDRLCERYYYVFWVKYDIEMVYEPC